MTVAELLIGSVILPRIESPKAISRLAEFEWFHKLDMQNETLTPEVDDLLLRAQKVHQFIEEIIKGLGIPLRVGIMEILFKGTVFKKKKYEIDEIENMITDLEKTPDIISKAATMLEENVNIKINQISPYIQNIGIIKMFNEIFINRQRGLRFFFIRGLVKTINESPGFAPQIHFVN